MSMKQWPGWPRFHHRIGSGRQVVKRENQPRAAPHEAAPEAIPTMPMNVAGNPTGI